MKQLVLFLAIGLAFLVRGADVIVEKGPHHDVHEVTMTEGEGENARTITNRFTVLQTGLNYLESNTWKSATTTIDLADSGAKFERGPFRVKFAADYHNAPLEITLSDGRLLKIQTIGLAMTDSSSGESVWLGESKASNGFLDADGASVVYPDSFQGIKADIVTRVSVGKFESDVVLREQVLDPRVLEWNPANVKLEIWHKFIELPEGARRPSYISRTDGSQDVDEEIDFGGMIMGQGLAFLVATNQAPISDEHGKVPVAKEVFHDADANATYLIESIPFTEAETHLSALPQRQEARLDRDAVKKRFGSNRSVAALKRESSRPERKVPISLAISGKKQEENSGDSPKEKKVAKMGNGTLFGGPGFVMDYTIAAAATNFTFQGSVTYLVTNSVTLSSLTTVEGGAVVKFSSGTTPVLRFTGGINCKTYDYHPAIFTASDDNSVGQTITGSNGSPSGFYGDLHFYFLTSNTNKITLHDIHSRYGRIPYGLYTSATNNEVWNLQAQYCRHAIAGYGNTVLVHNLLVEQAVSAMDAGKENTIFVAEHVTAHKVGKLFDLDSTTNSQAYVNNSLVVIATNSSSRVTYDSGTQTLTSDAGVFQTNKAGAHYLAKSSPYRAAGTTAVSAVMTNILKTATTYPPLELTNDFVANTTLAPRLPRGNSGGLRALGYHYPALDYVWRSLNVTDATLTLTNGVGIAGYGTTLVNLHGTGQLVSEGRPNYMNHLVTLESVQEQPTKFVTNSFSFINGFSANIRFTEISTPAVAGFERWLMPSGAWDGTVTIRDSTLRNVNCWLQDNHENGYFAHLNLTNNVVEHANIEIHQTHDPDYYVSLSLQNNLIIGSVLTIEHVGTNFGVFEFHDNLFDGCNLSLSEDDSSPFPFGGPLSASYNAYTDSTAVFGGSGNKVSLSLTYSSGPLGPYYYPTTGSSSSLTNLFDSGSQTNAGLVGLYHYSTRNDGSFEAASPLDIGHHYVVVDANGNPADSDGDGLANIAEDLNGNGLLDTGETSFADFDSDSDGMTDAVEKANGFDPRDGTSTVFQRLGTWDFRTSDLKADTGQIAQTDTYVVRDTNAFSIYAVSLTSTNSSLSYNEIEDIRHPNILRGLGAISLWFRPNWSTSTNTDVFSASLPGHLLCLGQSSGAKDDFWALRFTPKGDALVFETQAGGVAVTNLTASINWTNGGWYHVLLAYSSSNSWLYLNGNTNVASVVSSSVAPLVPASWHRSSDKLYFGCYSTGGGVALGAIDEVHTCNYVPTLEAIAAEYPGSFVEDPDQDGLTTLEEVALHTNPLNRDTDGDGMPDGWEVHALRMTPGTSFTHLNPLVADGSSDFDSDGLSNLEEYLRGTNPYQTNSLPFVTQPNRPSSLGALFNLDFGTNTSAGVGLAAAGYSTNDVWTKIGPKFSGTVYPANGSTNGAHINVYLQQTLGTVIKNLLPCPSTYVTNIVGSVTNFVYVTNVTIVQPTNPFCEGMQRTNAFGMIECCMPSGSIPPALYWQPWQPWIGRLNTLNEAFAGSWYATHSMISTYYPYLYVLPPPSESNVCVTSSGFLNYSGGGIVIGNNFGSDTLFRPPLWATSELYNKFWGTEQVQTLTVTNYTSVTNYNTSVTVSSWVYPEDYPMDERGARPPTQPLVVNTAMGWTEGFDHPGASSATFSAPNADMLRDYLTCTFDYAVNSLPISSGCNSYQFLRDGAARILITGVSGWYRVYLYAYADGTDKSLSVGVNDSTAKMPIVSTSFKGYSRGSYGGSTVYADGGMITLNFPTNRTLINGMQLMQLTKLNPPGNIQVGTNEIYGAMITFNPVPTATSFSIRRINIATGEEKTFTTWDNRFADPEIPRGVEVHYSIRSENEVPELMSDWSSEVVVAPQQTLQQVNHAPTIRGEIRLSGAYKNSPFNIGASLITTGADAFDMDGNAISFCISDLGEGTLKLKNLGTNTFSTVTTNDVSAISTNLLVIGGQTTISWEPPTDFSDNWVTAFYVRAYDSEFRSIASVPVRVYVKGPSVLTWWGSSVWDYTGDGSWAFMHDPSAFSQNPDQDDPRFARSWSSSPSPVLINPALVSSSTNVWLTNIVNVIDNGIGCHYALASDGTVWSWGDGTYGGLGDGQTIMPTGGSSPYAPWFTREARYAQPVVNISAAVSIATGWNHTLAATADGSVWSWGVDLTESGVLGQITTYPFASRPYSTNDFASNEFQSGALGTSSPQKIPGLSDVVQVAANGEGSAALTSGGKVYWWGALRFHVGKKDEGDDPVFAISSTPMLLPISGRVVQIAMGADFLLCLNDAGEIYAWGNNQEGQLGLGYITSYELTPRRVPHIAPAIWVSTAGYGCAAALKDQTVVQWGGILGLSPTRISGLRNISQISLGGSSPLELIFDFVPRGLAIDETGQMLAWGRNTGGVLGMGGSGTVGDDGDIISRPIPVEGFEQMQCVSIEPNISFGSMRVDRMTPHGLRPVSLSGEVDLSWKTFAGATAYELQRSVENKDDISFHTIAIVPQNPTAPRQAFADRNVTNGVSYLYRVSAIMGSGSTFYCDPVLAIPVPPPGPINFVESIALSRQIRVHWSRSMPTHDYALYRSVNGGAFTLLQTIFDGGMGYGGFAGDQDNVNLVDYAVVATNTYSYKVQATNMAGFGPMSVATAAISPTEDTLYPVSNVAVDISTSGEASVTWDPFDGWQGTYWVRAYELSGTNIARAVGGLQITAGTNVFFKGLRAGKTNVFMVSSVNEDAGESDPTSVQAAWWPPYLSATPIEFITAKSGPGFVYLKWRGDAVGYGVWTSPSTNIACDNNLVIPDASGVAEYFAALPANTYTFSLNQYYEAGGGTATTNKTLTVTSGTAATLPALNVTPANNRASITWYGSLADYGTNSTLFQDWRFILQRKEDANPAPECPGYWTIYDSNDMGKGSATMGVSDEEVLNGHSYRYRLYGISPDLDVVMEDSSSTITPFETFPSTNALTVTVTNYSGGVGLGWNALTNANGYRIESSSIKGGPYTAVGTTESTINWFLDRGLNNGLQVYYVVTATNVNGDTLPSAEVKGLPSESGALLKPYGFTADLHNQLLYLDWKLVAGADLYSVWQSTNRLWQGLSPAFTAAYVSTNSQYRYTVQAQRRGTTSSQDITVETIKWTAVTDAVLYRIDIVESGRTNLAGVSETPDFENVRLGTFTNFGSYIITAYNSANASISTNTSISTRGSVTPNLLTANEATISLTGLGSATNSALAINSPTNFWLRSLVANMSPATRAVTRVEYFMDGSYLGASTEWPYSWEWVNPAGSPSGTMHAMVARLVTSDNKSVDSVTGYLSVTARPELSAYTTSIADLQFPAPGMPLALSRSYDSRDSVGGILGKGWKFDWERSSITVPNVSSNWVKMKFNALTTQVYAEAQLHPIYVTIGGGREMFHPVAAGGFEPNEDSDMSGWDFEVAFAPAEASASGRLEQSSHIPDKVFIQEDYNGAPKNLLADPNYPDVLYTPGDLVYTAADGGAFKFAAPATTSGDRVYSLASMTDRYSNSVTYACGATNILVQHSNGRQIQLIQTNTLWSVFDPAELAITNAASRVPVLRYVVTNGFLIEVQTIRDRSAKTYDTNYYSYDTAGRLVAAAGPDGVVRLVNAYDSNSFVTKQGDAAGLDATLGYATVNGSLQLQVTQNVTGGTTNVAGFGPGGELASVQPDTGHANVVAQVGYTAKGLPAYQLQSDGTNVAYTSFAYDANGRPIEQVDALGNKTTTEYSSFGPLYTADALQNGTSYDYYKASGIIGSNINQTVNPEGALRLVTDAAGLMTSYTYNELGQTLTETRTSPFGGLPQVTKYVYFGNGDLQETAELIFKSGTNEVYVATDYAYDANGNRTNETRVRHIVARSGGAALTNGYGVPTLTTETQVTSFGYDGRNRLVKTTNQLGEVSGSLYNSNGKVASSTNTLGQVTSYIYDIRGNLLETAYPDGTVSRTAYDDRGRVSWTQERAIADTNSLTVAPATQTIYDPVGRAHLVYRHEAATLQRVTMSPTDWTNSISPGSYYRQLSSVTPATQYRMSVSVTGVVSSVTRTEYDTFGRVQYAVNALGGVTAYGYDLAGRRVATTNWPGYFLANVASDAISPGTNSYTVTLAEYDGNGNQIRSADGNGNVTDFFFDALNRRVVTQFPLVAGEDMRKAQWTVYDGLGRRTAEVDEAGIWTAFEYDLLGRLVTVTNDYRASYTTNMVPAITRYAYDELGNMTNEVRGLYSVLPGGSITNDPSLDRVTWFEYDKLGRRTYRFFPSIPASLNDTNNNVFMEKVSYSKLGYGPFTLQKIVRNQGNYEVWYRYDVMDRLIYRYVPVPLGFPSRTGYWDYTGAQLTTARENGTGIARTNYYAYDDGGRLRKKDTPEGVLTYTYRADGQVGNMQAYLRSRVVENTDITTNVPSVSIAYGYDALGRLSSMTNYTVSSNVTRYAYDLTGNQTVTAYPQHTRFTNSYDARNRMTTRTVALDSGTLLCRYDYGIGATSLRTSLTELNAGSGTNTVQRRKVNYRYDVGVAEGDVTITPALLNRLTHEDIIEGNGSDPTSSENFLYDGLGNRRIQNVSGISNTNVAAQAFEFNILDQARTNTSPNLGYFFDAAGNVTNAPGNVTFIYDSLNFVLKHIDPQASLTNISTFGIDSEGHRVWRHAITTVGTTNTHKTIYFLYDDQNPTGYPQVILESVDTSTVPAPSSAQFYAGNEWGPMLVSINYPSNTVYFAQDGHGSIRLGLDPSSGAAKTGYEWDFDAYGNVINTPSTTNDVHYLYSGYEWDPYTKKNHVGPREYDPLTGRWWSMDSYGGDPETSASLQKYLYCANDPVNRVDPTGNYSTRRQYWGYAVEDAVQDFYEQDNPGRLPILKSKRVFRIDNPARWLFPDIYDPNTKLWLEVKPLSPSGVASGEAKRRLNTIALPGQPDIFWQPPIMITIATGESFVCLNIAGVVYYQNIDYVDKELMVVIAAGGIYSASDLLKYLSAQAARAVVQGSVRPVLARALVRIGIAGGADKGRGGLEWGISSLNASMGAL